jgi:hypothetical protein
MFRTWKVRLLSGQVAAEECDDQSVRFQFPALSAITALTALFFSHSHP